MQNKIVRDKWVTAKIKVTKAGKILAKVAPGAVSGAKPKRKRATAKRVVKRAVKRTTPRRRNPIKYAVVDAPGYGHGRSNTTKVRSTHRTLALARKKISGSKSLAVISGDDLSKGDKVYLDTIGKGKLHPVVG